LVRWSFPFVISLATMACTVTNGPGHDTSTSGNANLDSCNTALKQDIGNTCETDSDCGSSLCIAKSPGGTKRCDGPVCSQNSDCNSWVTGACGGNASMPFYGYCGPQSTGEDRTCTAVAYATDPNKTPPGAEGGTDGATSDGGTDASDAD
jgi:hypothetical protein